MAKLSSYTEKTTPVNADKFPITDSADSNNTKNVLWSSIVSAIQTALTGIFQPAGSYPTGSGTCSGTNTGDEDATSIKTKLGITTLSGSNTGDQDLSSYLTTSYTDRGDPSADDFTSFTVDSAWHDLDLSSIVPAGAKAVSLRICNYNNTSNVSCWVRKNGNSNAVARASVMSVAGCVVYQTVTIACDTNRVIEYFFENSGSYSTKIITVLGWWK